MGVSLYPVLERDVAGYDAMAVVGKALANAVYDWNVPALAALGDFFSVSPEEVASLANYYLPDGEDAEGEEEIGNKAAPPDFSAATGRLVRGGDRIDNSAGSVARITCIS